MLIPKSVIVAKINTPITEEYLERLRVAIEAVCKIQIHADCVDVQARIKFGENQNEQTEN